MALDLEQHRRLYLGVGIAIAAAIVFMAIGLINEFAFAPRRVVGDATRKARSTAWGTRGA